MQNNGILIAVGILVIILLGGAVSYFSYQETAGPSIYDGFAQCLKDKEVTFFGAFWCPHCQAQKKMFGTAEKLLPYVECSTQDGQNQTQACKDEGIKGYPTWEFADGTRETGELSFARLSEKSGCALPDAGTGATINVLPLDENASSSVPAQ